MQANLNQASPKVVVYGGNGFVGVHTAHQLVKAQSSVVCVSRSGHKPLHLQDERWSKAVRWCKGDASEPKQQLLESADVMVCLVGSPPLPTFSASAYEKQVFTNGTACENAIQASAQAGIKKVILLGASIPLPLRHDRFGYFRGKKIALDAAQKFSQLSDQHSAIVLQPGAIYGKRHLSSGRVIPLDHLMAPLAKIMPSQFCSVQDVAQRLAHAATQEEPYHGKFSLLSNRDIPIN